MLAIYITDTPLQAGITAAAAAARAPPKPVVSLRVPHIRDQEVRHTRTRGHQSHSWGLAGVLRCACLGRLRFWGQNMRLSSYPAIIGQLASGECGDGADAEWCMAPHGDCAHRLREHRAVLC